MDRSEHMARILADWHARREQGDSLAPEEVVRRHPELADELRERFATIEAVDERFGTFAAIPKQIGEFRILREIGRGGMGIVYEAEQPSMRRRVALKVLLPSIVASPKAVERFQREAQAAGSLKHTNIVAVHQLGHDGGVWFSAMELVEGRPLSEVIDDLRKARLAAPLDRRSALLTGSRTGTQAYYVRLAEMFASVAEALEVAHEHGVVHRDVKPSNLLLDVEGELRIVDFGLARLDDAASMTVTGDVLGTPNYMSPEQIIGAREVDASTDVYSLGATLYEALTLRPPFVGATLPALIQHITRDEPRSPRRRDRATPRDLETIVLKALEKDPSARFASAGDLARELRRFASGNAIRARRISPAARAWRMVKRHRIRSALAATALVALLVGGLALRAADREAGERQRLEYDALVRAADREAVREWGAHEGDLVSMDQERRAFRLYSEAILHAPDRWRAYLGRALVRTTDVERGLEDVEAAHARGMPARTAHLARAFLHAEGYVGARSPREAARELEAARGLPPATELDDYLEGRALHGLRAWAEAERVLTRSLDRRTDEGPLRFLALYRRAMVRERLENWEGALRDFGAAQELVGDESLETRMRIASYWRRLGQPERARKQFDAVVTEAQAAGIGERAWWGLVISALQSGELAWVDEVSRRGLEALPDSTLLRNARFDVLLGRRGEVEQALAVVSAPASMDATDWETHTNRGRALARLWRHDEALVAFDRALRESPRNPMVHTNRAVSLSALERDAEALAAVDAALASAASFPPALAHKASILLRRGKTEEALALARRAVELAGPQVEAWARHVHAMALRASGDMDGALAEVDRAIEAAPDSADAHWARAEILRERGAFVEALAAFERAIELDGRHKPAHQGRALVLTNDLQRPEEGLAAWEALVALPHVAGSAEAHLWIGNLRQMRGEWAAAVESFVRVLAAPPLEGIDLGLVASSKARCLGLAGRAEDAFAAAEDALVRSPEHPGVLCNVAGVYQDNGRLAQAVPLLEKALALDPNLAVARFNLGLALHALGRGEDALATFDAFIAAVPNHPDGYFERGRLLHELLQRNEAALADAERVLAMEGPSFRASVLLGHVYLALQQPEKALAAYDAALALNAAFMPAQANRALILASVGTPEQVEEAFRVFEDLLKAEAHPVTLSMYARCLAANPHPSTRKPKRAVEVARKALAASPGNPDVLNTLGVSLAAAEQWREALQRLEQAAEARDGGNGVDWIYMALVHARTGELDKARALQERARAWIAENAPKSRELARASEEVARLLE